MRTLGFLLIMPQISWLWWCCVPPLSGGSPPFSYSRHISWSFCGHLRLSDLREPSFGGESVGSDPCPAAYYLQCLGGVLCPASVSSSVKWVSPPSFIDAARVLKRTATGPSASIHNRHYHAIVSLALQPFLQEDLALGSRSAEWERCRFLLLRVAVRNE